MWVGFTGLLSVETLEKAGFSPMNPVRKVLSSDMFKSYIEGMVEAHQMTYINELKRNAYFFNFLANLINDYSLQSGDSEKINCDYQYSLYAKEVYDYVMHNFFKVDLQISNIADYIGISRNYLFLCFKKKYQISPKQFLISVRMKNASSMLANEYLTISEIAYKVGYSDEATFSKQFKKYFNISPASFRKNLNLKTKINFINSV